MDEATSPCDAAHAAGLVASSTTKNGVYGFETTPNDPLINLNGAFDVLPITLSWIVLIALLGLLVLQAILVFKYFGFMVSHTPSLQQPTGAEFSPRVAVVLCLRGSDPSLNACLESLLAQDYGNFEVHFVIDAPEDPAVKTIRKFLERNSNSLKSKTIFLTEGSDSNLARDTCSLKNQSLIAAITDAEKAIEVFALVDADGAVEKNWLSGLVAPMIDPEVGATTGSRWFAPADRNPGSLVRQTWNAAALPQMHFYNIPWGGALAIRRSAIQACDLLSHWSHGFCEDTMLTKILASKNFRVTQVPGVIVQCAESTSLPEVINWISRQLLTVRLHHNSWPLVLGHAIFSGGCLAGALVMIGWCFWAQHFLQGTRLTIAVVIFLAANVLLLQVIQLANRQGRINALAHHPQTSNKLSSNEAIASSPAPGLFGSLLTQLLYPLIAVKAALMRKVQWRGITYTIGPGKKISLDGYQPYQESDDNTGNNTSL